MASFLRQNLLLVLTVVGAAASFLATLVGLLSKKKPVLVLAALAVVGFAVGIAYQLHAHDQAQKAAHRKAAEDQIYAAARLARDNIIKEINLKVTETQVTVSAIAERLSARSWAEVGTELVTIQTSGQGFQEPVAFAMGSRDMCGTDTRNGCSRSAARGRRRACRSRPMQDITTTAGFSWPISSRVLSRATGCRESSKTRAPSALSRRRGCTSTASRPKART